jgi:hypothetical protein
MVLFLDLWPKRKRERSIDEQHKREERIINEREGKQLY